MQIAVGNSATCLHKMQSEFWMLSAKGETEIGSSYTMGSIAEMADAPRDLIRMLIKTVSFSDNDSLRKPSPSRYPANWEHVTRVISISV
ncbi:hypothetical protein NYV33_26575 [Escherichia coli]|nr:hypothetical protein [Escherichia coli]